jgi:phosphoribosyl 1,2-cyclic phosphodiesterase
MKNAILVSADKHWRTVMEGTLLSRGWVTASVETLVQGEMPDPVQVQALIIDAASVARGALTDWLTDGAAKLQVPVVIAPGLTDVERFADALEGQMRVVEKEASPVVVRFWGVRGSIPTPGPSTSFYGGNTSCVEVEADGETIILDAGSGIRPLGLNLMGRAAGKPLNLHLLISHTHWDHIQGLPFFVPAYISTNHLRVVVYSEVRHDLAHVLEVQMDSAYFPVAMKDLPSHPDVEEAGDHFSCGPVEVEGFFTNHPGLCAGYKLLTSVGTIVYVSDNELNFEGQAIHLPAETADHMHQRFIATLQGARVLIHDAQYTRAEYKSKITWGHSAFEDTVELAGESGVEHLILFHHDPMRTDAQINQMVLDARAIVAERGWEMRVDAAREGMEIPVYPRKPALPAS